MARAGSLAQLMLCVAFMAMPALAVDEIIVQVESIAGPAWQARDVQMRLRWDGVHHAELRMEAGQLVLPALSETVRAVQLYCPRAEITSEAASCRDGTVSFDAARLPQAKAQIRFDYQFATGNSHVSLAGLAIAAGRLAVDARLSERRWQATLQARGLQIAALGILSPVLRQTLADYAPSGVLSVDAQLDGGTGLDAVSLTGTLREVNFADRHWRRAAEALEVGYELSAARVVDGWRFAAEAEQRGGILLLHPVILEAEKGALRAEARGALGSELLELEHVGLDYPGIAQVTGQAELQLGDSTRLTQLRLSAPRLPVKGLLGALLTPVTQGTLAGALDSDGHLGIEYRQDAHGAQLRAHVDDVYLDDRKRRFGLYALNGVLEWDSKLAARSMLGWDSGYVYRVPLGAAAAQIETQGGRLALAEPLQVPIFDGVLQVGALQAEGVPGPDMRWQFEASLSPVDMVLVSHALGWPTMSGKLSGIVPTVSYQDGDVKISGALLVRAFDGSLIVRNTHLIRPFSTIPVLTTDVDIVNLDLSSLTRTFSFGRIEGRLSGAIHNLRLEQWQPTRFDARFTTPPDDDSRHRISQRAVDSLTRVGGGGAGALSRSLLRFFEDFSYDRLGISCILRRGVCEMNGVQDHAQGYYIVKGGGLPSIDVIGYNRRVDWQVLLSRLKRVTTGRGPVIE